MDWLSQLIFGAVMARFDRLDAAIAALQKGQTDMSNELQALADQVKANTDAEASAIQVINQIAADLANAKEDPAQVQALTDQLKASASALAAAIVANTPAAPQPTA